MKQQIHPKTLIIVYSYHHGNTMKVAKSMSEELYAKIITPAEIDRVDLNDYQIIGFGAGIDSGKHYEPLIDLCETLPYEKDKTGFIFSTSAIQGIRKVTKDHAKLRSVLISKGYSIIAEFSCKGFNTNSFLRFFGGMNKGKPDLNDLDDAKSFAKTLMQETSANL